jgi:hypothetical protein
MSVALASYLQVNPAVPIEPDPAQISLVRRPWNCWADVNGRGFEKRMTLVAAVEGVYADAGSN